jgi:hypothetical protein
MASKLGEGGFGAVYKVHTRPISSCTSSLPSISNIVTNGTTCVSELLMCRFHGEMMIHSWTTNLGITCDICFEDMVS